MRKLLAFVIAALLVAPGLSRVAQAEVTVDVFYKALEPHGEWIETSDYGYVFHPKEAREDWRPYTDGNWAYTDAGWTWVSEEPFGWATYHYGRWAQTDSVGWVWVPDTQWGPAWVSWRRSPKYVGWAPLPPEADFEREVGIKTWSDSYYDVGPANYSFVEVRQFGAPRLATVILPPRETVTVIRETRNITNITYVNNVVYNGGPEYDVVVRESAQPIRRLRLDRRTDIVVNDGNYRDDVFRTQVSGDSLRVAAPDIRYVADARPARVARRVEHVEVKRGWDVVKDKQQAQQLRADLNKDAAKVPDQLPKQPKFERLAQRAERREKAGENAPATGQTAAPADATKPGRTAADRERMPAARDGQAVAPGEPQPGAKVGVPPGEDRPNAGLGDRPNRQGKQGEKNAAQAGEKMRDGTTPGADGVTPTETAPGATTTPDATAPDAGTKPEGRGKGARAKENQRKAREMERNGANATAPGPDGAKPDAVATPPTENATPKTPDNADAQGRMKRPDAREPRGGNVETPQTQPGQPNRRGERDDGAKPADKPAAAPQEKPESKPSPAKPEKAERPDRPEVSAPTADRPDRPGKGERPEKSERPDRPDRPQKADRPDAGNRPEKADRPEAGNRPEKPDRPEKAERPDRPAQGAGKPEAAGERERGPGAGPKAGGGERPGRGEGGKRGGAPGEEKGPDAGAPGR